MKNRDKLLLSLLALPLTMQSVEAKNRDKKSGDDRPNFVVILCDDVSSDMFGCYGNSETQTPNIDRLAAQGVAFQSGWNSALSGPARAQLMTGKYATTTGVWSNGFALPMPDGSPDLFTYHPSYSKVLHDAGYTTAVAGKWHVGGAQHQDDPSLGFDTYCMWESDNTLAKLGYPEWRGGREMPRGITARYWHPCIVQDGKLLDTKPTDFGPDIFTGFICDFIEDVSKEEKPFFAYYPMVMPHGPYVKTPLTTKQGDNNDLKRGEYFAEMINYVDILVGRIVAQVERSGKLDNTIFIFMADNGTAVTAKSRGVDRGCRVPFIFAGVGIKERGLTREICDGTDIFPTVVEFAEATSRAPKDLDGVSMVDFLTGKSDKHKDMIHSCIGTTQLLRTRECLLEVYNPILGVPEGRFYYCGDSHDGRGYVRAEGDERYKAVHQEMLQLLRDKYKGLTLDHPFQQEKRGKAFMTEYTNPKSVEKHLHNHRDYQFYNED